MWESAACAPWHDALDKYPAAVAVYGSARLVELDTWLREELPGRITEQGRLTLEDLVWATEWKMLRGEWRPRNLQLVRGNAAGEVDRLSAEALKAVPDPRHPLALLTRLSGVGPATASAVLATAAPDHYPFLDEAVGRQISDLGPVQFTSGYYQRYAAALRERAIALSAACTHRPWPVHDLDLALWSSAGGKKPGR